MRLGLKVAVLQRRLSQRQVAQLAGIPENRFSTIVNGWTEPTAAERARLASVLGQGEDVLFGADTSIETSERSAVTGEIPADVRQLIVRQLGAAFADAWRRQHREQNHVHQREELAGEGAADDAPTSPAAV